METFHLQFDLSKPKSWLRLSKTKRLSAFQFTVYWIGPTNSQLKGLRTRNPETRNGRKILWHLILSCSKMNCEWDNVKNRPQTGKVGFWKLNDRNWLLAFESQGQFDSVFRKLITDIFIGGCTSLLLYVLIVQQPMYMSVIRYRSSPDYRQTDRQLHKPQTNSKYTA